ncbi:DUF4837 family protein [candidate division WOR-3 bacterium]|nr:DUF4837 family protein [candidate division WOR-3 bacterium]
MMLKSLAILPFLILAGCTQYKPPYAIGKSTQIVVISKNNIYPEIKDLLSASLERVIYTPTTEYIFDIKKASPEKFKELNYKPNILIAGLIGEPFIDSILVPEAKKKILSGESYIFGKQDLFISGQYVLIIATPTVEKLRKVIKDNSDLIFNYFAEGVRKRLKEILYKDGYQEELAKNLQTKYGFSISIPPNWLLAQDKVGFVEFIHHFPDRIISIYWEASPGNELNKEEVISLRNKIGAKYYDGDTVDTLRTNFYWVQFHGLLTGKLDGIWENDEQVTGGPFRSYFFTSSGRLYCIDMHIFAPGEKKWRWLQQLEIICDTFQG